MFSDVDLVFWREVLMRPFFGAGQHVLSQRLAGRWPWTTCDVQHAGVWMDPNDSKTKMGTTPREAEQMSCCSLVSGIHSTTAFVLSMAGRRASELVV